MCNTTGAQTPDLHLDIGQHRLDGIAKRLTQFGSRQVGSFTEHLLIEPKGGPVVITIHDWAF